MRLKLITLLFLFPCFSYSKPQLLYPINDSQLNYIYILFQWENQEDSVYYKIQLSEDQNFENVVVESQETQLFYFEKENIEWNKLYYWRVGQKDDNNEYNLWSDISSFTTISSTYELLEDTKGIEVIVHNPQKVFDGVLIFGSYFNNYSSAIDVYGNEVWNSGSANSFVFFNRSSYGELLGGIYNDNHSYILSGGSVNKDVDLIFEEIDNGNTINNEFLQHEILKLPNGNYLSLAPDKRLGPIPKSNNNVPFEWEQDFRDYGFAVDGVSEEFYWLGEKIIEWDANTGDVIWELSAFDIYSLNDYDVLGNIWKSAAQDISHPFDWTHFNALAYDEEEQMIYVSSRHLSTITKIDYNTRNVIWNLGYDQKTMNSNLASYYGFDSNNSFIDMSLYNNDGDNTSFSFQHGLQILENGNIVTLDNGNLSTYIFGYENPKTRAIEIQVNEENGIYQAEIVWEYSLPDSLYGAQSGNAQKLDNGNYLITVTARGGTSWEVSPSKELVWECRYNLRDGDGPIYRANKYSDFLNTIICSDGQIVDDCGVCGGSNTACNSSLKTTSFVIPEVLEVKKIFPNPFNSRVSISLSLGKMGKPNFKIFDVKGREIDQFSFGFLPSGNHSVVWDARGFDSGLYFVEISFLDYKKVRKVLLIK